MAALRGAGSTVGRPGPWCSGGGATAASAVAALRELGEPEPTVVVRSARERAGAVSRRRPSGSASASGWSRWDQAGDALPAGAAVVVSTGPPGCRRRPARPPDRATGVLLDVVYRPWPTGLGAAWAAAGRAAVPRAGDARAPGGGPGRGLDRANGPDAGTMRPRPSASWPEPVTPVTRQRPVKPSG